MLTTFVQKLAQKRIKSSQDFLNWKRKLVAELKTAPPSTVEILNLYRDLRKNKKIDYHPYFEKQLKKRPVRSLSGVAVISVLTKPWPCPGHCLYCPLEPGIPKSYLSGEPAVERAKLLKYDPYQQVRKRIEALERTGHPTDKIELIIIGASWTAYPKKYQEYFIKRCFDGANS
ncbi:MAG: tRNA uridine(34) 5-carboxymethylaminomethyl modification radical SAM/GNAT enzyme Elp3, partial [Patescibacteria group bacterium]